jgi:hypothetical protein
VIDHNIVSITASSVYSPQSHPVRQVADFENQTCFATNEEATSWICYDFKDRQIKKTHYSIRTCSDYDTNHLRSWPFDGSKDGVKGVKIDDRQNDKLAKSTEVISAFSLSESVEEEFGQVRLQQTGKNGSSNEKRFVNVIEFFGVLKVPRHDFSILNSYFSKLEKRFRSVACEFWKDT